MNTTSPITNYPRSFRLGITGKIGSGKSVFSSILREEGITVLDSDSLAKDIMSSDKDIRNELTALIGEGVYTESGLDTKFLALKIFSDDDMKMAVEAIVHPRVSAIIENAFDKAKPGEIVGVESALFLQTAYDDMFDALILIDSSDNSIIERNTITKRFSENDLLLRLADQGFTEAMNADADFVIKNDTTLDTFKLRSKMILPILQAMASGNLPKQSLRSLDGDE